MLKRKECLRFFPSSLPLCCLEKHREREMPKARVSFFSFLVAPEADYGQE